jgi:hypothetical protein
VYLSVQLSAQPSVYLSVQLSAQPSVYLSVQLSVQPSVYLSVQLSVQPSACTVSWWDAPVATGFAQSVSHLDGAIHLTGGEVLGDEHRSLVRGLLLDVNGLAGLPREIHPLDLVLANG